VVLPTGEVEVLMTSFIDSGINREEFKKLYGLRWRIETFFGVLKGALLHKSVFRRVFPFCHKLGDFFGRRSAEFCHDI
jgi:hypothetical protein